MSRKTFLFGKRRYRQSNSEDNGQMKIHHEMSNEAAGAFPRPCDDKPDITLPKHEITSHMTTEAKSETNSPLGQWLTFFLTLGRTSFALTIACLVPLVYGNLAASSQSVFQWLAWLSGLVSVIFFVLAAYVLLQQRQQRKN